ncbi:MAG: DUF5103 domain-containing protein [Cyclobacteriaceae bacterium]|nr:DUF5103 domain-containing protein [Cyclobacteriaceae bacterium]
MTRNHFRFFAAGRAFAAIPRFAGFPLQSLADGTSSSVLFIHFSLLLISVLLTSSVFAQPTLEYIDKNYEPQIKTVQLYPSFDGARDYLQSPAAPIENQNLLLEFDDLQDQRNNYYVKLIHCNYDWTQ